jgi:hypothetical protein
MPAGKLAGMQATGRPAGSGRAGLRCATAGPAGGGIRRGCRRPGGWDGEGAGRHNGPLSYSDAYSRFHLLSRPPRRAAEGRLWAVGGTGSRERMKPRGAKMRTHRTCTAAERLQGAGTEAADGDAAAAAVTATALASVAEVASATAFSASSAAKCSICRSSGAKSRRTSSRHVLLRSRAWQQHTRDSNHMVIVCVAQALRNSNAQRGGTLNADPHRCQQAISFAARNIATQE